MAHYVRVPKDLNDIKEKFIANLTKRQVICFGIGFLAGLPTFLLTKGLLGMSGAITAMGIAAAPAIVCGLYRKNGVFFEQHIKFMIEFFKRPKKRYYRTSNIYRCIENNIEYMRISDRIRASEGGSDGFEKQKKTKK